ncbi:MAG: Holliday junction resolvase RuvX, partial [Thermodesulfobacteriota bacterium]
GLGLTAQGLTVLDRKPNARFYESLEKLVKEYDVGRIVLGLPRRMDGSLGPEAQRVLALASQLRSILGLEVITWDERLSTAAAERVLIEADLSRKKRKEVRDKVAAVIILQNYLDFLSPTRTEADR